MVRKEDRPALKRIISTIFNVEAEFKPELTAILEDKSLSPVDRADKYIDTIIDHLDFCPVEEDDIGDKK